MTAIGSMSEVRHKLPFSVEKKTNLLYMYMLINLNF